MPELTTFLLVEDNPDDVFLVKRHFKEAPARIRLRSVTDSVEAIRYLEGQGEYADRQEYPLPNVILLDLNMPRLNGFDFLEWLRSGASGQYRLIPVVVMSSSALEEEVARAYALGVNSYMVKPVDWQKFRERIKTLGIYWAEHVETPGISSPNP